ncbi:MAG: helix-turn-helix domain-containing protein [Thermoleophilia bacterium]|jgi:hypothetical protein|nr:helix-turn-helix domain-containing protein [Thermoleophilia bacterium]
MPDPPAWSSEPFGPALRAAMGVRGLSFRALESRTLVPVGNLHDHVSGRRGVPGDALMERIAAGLDLDPWYFREYRERRLVDALRADPEAERMLARTVRAAGLRGLLAGNPQPGP